MSTASSFDVRNNVKFYIENVTPQNTALTSTDSTPLSNTQKVEKIFNGRASIRSNSRTIDKIKTVAAVTLAIIGLAAIVAGIVLGAGATLPIGAAIGIVIGGYILGYAGTLSIPTKRILKDEEEEQFWKAISTNSLSELTSKRWNWYCVGAPYFGPVRGVCEISYKELQNNDLISLESAKKLQALLDGSNQLEQREAQEIRDEEKNTPNFLASNAKERIRAKYLLLKQPLQAKFEAFRNAFIQETYQKFNA
jgi:hypothetical protein